MSEPMVERILLEADTAEPGPDGPWSIRRLLFPSDRFEVIRAHEHGNTVAYASHITESQARTVRNALNRDARRGKEGDK